MICGQTAIHYGKKDTKTVSSKTFVTMGVVQLLYVKTEAKSLVVVMKYSLSHFLWGFISTKNDRLQGTRKNARISHCQSHSKSQIVSLHAECGRGRPKRVVLGYLPEKINRDKQPYCAIGNFGIMFPNVLANGV